MYLLFILLGFFVVGSIAFSIYYYFASNKYNFKEWKETELTAGKRILWLGNLILMILSIWFTVYCLIKPDSFGAFGLLIWLITSIAAGYFCSPLKPFSFLDGQDGKSGCATFLLAPWMWVTTVVTGLLTMLTSWIFNLITVLRKTDVTFKVVACLLFAAALIVPPTVVVCGEFAEQKQAEEAELAENALVDGIIAKVEAAFESGKAEKIAFTDDEIAYCNDRETNPILLADSYGVAEKKISEFYNKKDFAAIIKISDVYGANGSVLDTYITSDLFEFMKNEIEENGEIIQYHQVSKSPIYSYGKYEVTVGGNHISFKVDKNDLGDEFRLFTEKDTEKYDSVWVAGETVTEKVNS